MAVHQTLCPACRAPVPSDAGPLASSSEGSSITVSAPPPRAGRAPAPPPTGDDPPAPEPPPEPARTAAGWSGSPVVAPVDDPDPTVVADPSAEATAVAGSGWAGAAEPTWRQDPSAGPDGPAAAPPSASSAGSLGVLGAPSIDDRGNLPGGLLALIGAVLVGVGVALPWLDVAGETVSGWAASGDAKVLAGLAACALVMGALVVGGARSLVLRAGLAVVGVVAVGFGIYELLSVGGIEDLDPSPGMGLYVGLVGGAVLVASAALTRHRRFR